MITIAWYNIVAIIAGILGLIWINTGNESYDSLGIGGVFNFGFKLFIVIIFFIIWGGIFWW